MFHLRMKHASQHNLLIGSEFGAAKLNADRIVFLHGQCFQDVTAILQEPPFCCHTIDWQHCMANWNTLTEFKCFVIRYNVDISALSYCITRVPDQNGVSRQYNMPEVYHSGPGPLIMSSSYFLTLLASIHINFEGSWSKGLHFSQCYTYF